MDYDIQHILLTLNNHYQFFSYDVSQHMTNINTTFCACNYDIWLMIPSNTTPRTISIFHTLPSSFALSVFSDIFLHKEHTLPWNGSLCYPRAQTWSCPDLMIFAQSSLFDACFLDAAYFLDLGNTHNTGVTLELHRSNDRVSELPNY